MRCGLILFLLLTCAGNALCQRGAIKPSLTYTTNLVANFTGGDKKVVRNMGLIDAAMLFYTDSAKWWRGGILNIEVISTYGKGISINTLHDQQGISNIEAGNNPILPWELWYHQQLGSVGIRVGLQNINSDFMNTSYGGAFSCSSYGLFPTLTRNYSIASYPIAGLGISASYQLTQKMLFTTGLYNGEVSNLTDDRYNIHWKLNPSKYGILSITELRFDSYCTNSLYKTFGLGFVLHNKPFREIKNRKDEFGNYVTANGNYTVYAFAEHQIFRRGSKSIGALAQISYAPKDRNACYFYSSVGIIATDLLSLPLLDKIGVGFSQVSYINNNNELYEEEYEVTLEAFCTLNLHKKVFLKPTFFVVTDSSKPCITAAMLELNVAL